MDASTDKINGKVLHAEEAKVHTMLVLGRRDLEAGVLSVRVHGRGNLGARPRGEVIADLLEAIRERRPN
jgi:threonyl-tRNA synthetase